MQLQASTLRRSLLLGGVTFLLLAPVPGSTREVPSFKAAAEPGLPASRAELVRYIDHTWATLTRSLADLPRAAEDPKLDPPANGRWPVYVSEKETLDEIAARLKEELGEKDLARLELRRLPATRGAGFAHGLLYLPRPYVVPGGRFNEMYGWDSYFIVVGLLRSGEVALGRDMVDNFVYEIEHYGMVLNANRTYYLTRSQPPLLTPMVLGVYRASRDQAWLRSVLPALHAYHAIWTRPPHLVPEVGLSRYHDSGEGPAPEVVVSEVDDEGRSHYDRVRQHFRELAERGEDIARFYDTATNELSEAFYDADRAMRESGFDPSGRFGPVGAETLEVIPVCLNALLYGMERDLGEIHEILGDVEEAAAWRERAKTRRRAVDRYLWDGERGLYLDYDLRRKARRDYLFATTFYPLWVGLATPDQAQRLVAAALPPLEAACGLRTSNVVSGAQWDAPYGWAPMQLIAVDGLRRYGFEASARRLALRFIDLVASDLAEHGTIVEKYDVEQCRSDLGDGLRFGYTSNEAGFGWTNGVVLELLADVTEPDIH